MAFFVFSLTIYSIFLATIIYVAFLVGQKKLEETKEKIIQKIKKEPSVSIYDYSDEDFAEFEQNEKMKFLEK